MRVPVMRQRLGHDRRPALSIIAAAAAFCCSLVRSANALAFSSCAPKRIGSTSSGISTSNYWYGTALRAAHVCRVGPPHEVRRCKKGGAGRWTRGRGARRGATELRSSEGQEEDAANEAFESIFDKNSAILDVPLELFDENRPDPTVPGSTQTEMPVFMLDVAACPGGVVPLHIFEMRYRQMFNDIGTKDNRFGMLVSDPTTGRPCKYGAVMECAQRKLLPDGRQYVLNQAVERFRVLKVVKSAPYTVMEVEVGIPDEKPMDGEPSKWGADEGTRLDDLEKQVFSTVNSVVELMNKLSPPVDPTENRTLSEWFMRYSPEAKKEASDGEAGADDLQAQEDERRMKFSYAVAEMIAMAPHTKQLLLQSRSTAYRLMAEREILVKAQKELAARSSLKDTLG